MLTLTEGLFIDPWAPGGVALTCRIGSATYLGNTDLCGEPKMTEPEAYRVLTELFREVFADDTLVLRPDLTVYDVDGWGLAHELESYCRG